MIKTFHLSASFPCVRAKAWLLVSYLMRILQRGIFRTDDKPMIGKQRSCTIATYPALFHFSLHSTEYLPLSL